MRGKWAAGIPPRKFTWVIMDRIAVSERPGGFAANHRRVRRSEEIIWLRGKGFTQVISLLSSPHNLQAYEEHHLPSVHLPLPTAGDVRPDLAQVFHALDAAMSGGERVLVHQDELGDRVMGVMAAYLAWSRRLATAPQAIAVVERLLGQPMGPHGRELVGLVDQPEGSGTSPEP